MHHSVRQTFLSILCILVLVSGARADEAAFPAAVFRSVLLLELPGKGCATGFLTEHGDIVTNAHVTDFLCHSEICEGAHVRVASDIQKRPTISLPISALRLKRVSHTFDLAVLAPEWLPETPAADRRGSFLIEAPPANSTGGRTHVLGFPRCLTLSHSVGTALMGDDIVSHTNHSIDYGSSGSPVFNDSFQIAGVVAEASSLQGALGSLVFGTQFQTGAIRGNLLESFLRDDFINLRFREASELSQLYSRSVLTKSGIERVMATFDYTVRCDGLKKDLLTAPEGFSREIAAALALWSEDPQIFPNFEHLTLNNSGDSQSLVTELILLGLAYRLENMGARRNVLDDLSLDSFSQALDESKVPPDLKLRLHNLFASFLNSGYPGALIEIAKYLAAFTFAFALCISLWSLSFGYVVGTARGSFLRRILVALFVGLSVWPLSFFIYLRSGRSKA